MSCYWVEKDKESQSLVEAAEGGTKKAEENLTQRHQGSKAQRLEGKEMRDVLRKKDNDQIPDFSVSYPYPYSSRRDFTAEGEEDAGQKKRRLNTKAFINRVN